MQKRDNYRVANEGVAADDAVVAAASPAQVASVASHGLVHSISAQKIIEKPCRALMDGARPSFIIEGVGRRCRRCDAVRRAALRAFSIIRAAPPVRRLSPRVDSVRQRVSVRCELISEITPNTAYRKHINATYSTRFDFNRDTFCLNNHHK